MAGLIASILQLAKVPGGISNKFQAVNKRTGRIDALFYLTRPAEPSPINY